MNEDQTDIGPQTISPSELKVVGEESTTVLETINFPDGTSILRLPDKDGRPIYFPSYRISQEYPDDLLPGKRHEVLKDIGRADTVIQGQLSEEQLSKLEYALGELKLPAILAVHAALNTDINLESYPKPKEDMVAPVTMAMLGRPGVGKSFMSGLLSYREGYPIINLDLSSGVSSVRYRKLFEQEGRGDDLSVEQAWNITNDLRIGKVDFRQIRQGAIRKMLNDELEKILLSPERQALYIVDTPGLPGRYDYGTGRIHGKRRPFDIMDIVAREACESNVISSHQVMVEPIFGRGEPAMEKKLRWIVNDVIANNLNMWREIRQDFVSAVKQELNK